MKGDFSRLTFNPGSRYTRVLMQQGRVQLDADWNERQEIDRHLSRAGLQAGIGQAGVPAAAAGFAPAVTADGRDISIGPGQLYAEGRLCECAGTTLFTQPDLPVQVATFSGPVLPGLARPTKEGRYLLYLDVWERDVTALQDPLLRETALGGPDTATRTRLVWQARLEAVPDHAAAEDFPPGWTPAALNDPPGRMLAATLPPAAAPGPCVLPPGASYTSLSNQLYRVEVHRGGFVAAAGAPAAGPAPTFKWSRDNGGVVTAVTAVAGQVLTVADLGPDDVLGFQPNQVVELIDDRAELAEGRGTLLVIAPGGIDTSAGTVTIDPATPLPGLDNGVGMGPLLLRRWDQPAATGSAGVAIGTGAVALEAGITVSFRTGLYRAGDWWTFAARTAIDASTGNIVWPGAPGHYLPPQGTHHSHVPLALVDFHAVPGTFSPVEDCRALFAPAAGRLPALRARCSRDGRLADLVPGDSLTLEHFGQGVMVATAATLDATSLTPVSVRLVAEIPATVGTLLNGGDNRLAGTFSVTLAADVVPLTAHRAVVTPRAAVRDMLAATLNRQFLGASDADFATHFTVFDTPGSPAAAWKVQGDGTLAQFEGSAGGTGHGTAVPAAAVFGTALNGSAVHAGMTAVSGAEAGDVGLVFNWLSAADYWVVFHTYFWTTVGFSGAFSTMQFCLGHFVGGQLQGGYSTSGAVTPRSGPNGSTLAFTVDIDVVAGGAAGGGGLQFGARITWADGVVQTVPLPFAPPQMTVQVPTILPTGAPALASISVPVPIPAALVNGSRMGVMLRDKATARFTRLQWTGSNDALVQAIPLGSAQPILVRLVVKRELVRTAAEAAAAHASGMPVVPAPEPDFETAFFVTPNLARPYSAGYAAAAWPGLPGIGTEVL